MRKGLPPGWPSGLLSGWPSGWPSGRPSWSTSPQSFSVTESRQRWNASSPACGTEQPRPGQSSASMQPNAALQKRSLRKSKLYTDPTISISWRWIPGRIAINIEQGHHAVFNKQYQGILAPGIDQQTTVDTGIGSEGREPSWPCAHESLLWHQIGNGKMMHCHPR